MCDSTPAKHEIPKYHFGKISLFSWMPALMITGLTGLASLGGLYGLWRWSRFSEKSTIGAMKTAESIARNVDLNNRVAIITGASDGLGKETARVLLKQGATVIMGVRDRNKGDEARNEIINSLTCKEKEKDNMVELEKRIIMLSLDLSSFQSIRDFVINFYKLNLPLHYLINNGGIMALPNYELSKDGIEMQFQVNYLSHYYLTRLLNENLTQTQSSRVTNISSIAFNAAPRPFSEWINKHYHLRQGPLKEEYSSQGYIDYGISKACVILFTREYENRYPNTKSLVVHPGMVDTKLWNQNKWFKRFRYSFLKVLKFLPSEFKNVQQGAATTVWTVVAPDNELKGGEFYRDCLNAQDQLRTDLLPNLSTDDVKEIKLWELSEQLIRNAGFDFTL